MWENERFYIIFERHIGFGIRWDSFDYWLDISIAIPFVTFVIGIGQKQN